MENQQIKTGSFALKYGALLGGIGITFGIMLVVMELHYEQSWAVTAVNIAIMIAAIIIGIYQFKKANGDYLSLSQALKVGIGVALVAAILNIIYMLILTNVIEPDFWDKSLEIGKSVMLEKNPNMIMEQANNAIEMQKKFMWITYPMILIFNIFVGFVISLIAGLAMKKEKSEF